MTIRTTRSTAILAVILTSALALPLAARAGGAMPDVTLAGHKGAIEAVVFSPDGKRLASVDDAGVLKVWDVAGRRALFDFGNVVGEPRRVAFTPDGACVVVIAPDRKVTFLDAATGKERTSITVDDLPSGPTAFDISADGKTLAVVGRSALRCYELPGGKRSAAYDVHENYGVTAVAVSADGTRVATASTDHTSLVLDPATGTIAWTFKLNLNGKEALFSHDGKTLMTSAADGVVRAFDLTTGDGRTLFEGVVPRTLALSKDGRTLVIGGPGRGPWTLALPDGKPVKEAYDSPNFVYAAALSPGGDWIAGGANDGSVYLWKVAK